MNNEIDTTRVNTSIDLRIAQRMHDIGQHLVSIGDVHVHEHAIRTPTGFFPLRGSQWAIVTQPTPAQQTPSWANVVAIMGAIFGIVFAFFTCGLSLFMLLSLCFLSCKETRFSGPVLITVSSGRQRYNAQEVVHSIAQINNITQRVNYCQMLASA